MGRSLHPDSRRIATVLDGVVEQISEDHFQQQASGGECDGRDIEFENVRYFLFLMQTGGSCALPQQVLECDVFSLGALANGVQATDFQQLVDEPIKSGQLVVHGLVEFAAIVRFRFVQQQGVEVEAECGDRSFQLMSDAVDKVGLATIELDFLDGQEGIEGDAEEADGECCGAEDEAAPGTLAGQLDDEHGHQGDVNRHQQYAAPDGQAEVATFSAKIGHGAVSPGQGKQEIAGAEVSKVCQISGNGQNGAAVLSGNSSNWLRTRFRQHFRKSVPF